MAAKQTSDHADGSFDLDKLHAEVCSWFQRSRLERHLQTGRTELEELSLDWLAMSGKRWRPFLVASLYSAFRGDFRAPLPDPLKRICVAVECIHKASLIYDDIQDDDPRRYGAATLHREHGVPVALTASLFLLGQGYRLIAGCGLPADQCTEMLRLATQGHCDLCLGQGRELLWMRRPKPLTPEEVLEIFSRKTAPSFAVVFRLPAICAGAGEEVHRVLEKFSLITGTAYQIQDDLSDFHGREDGDDVLARRPSIVLALAHARARGAERKAIAAAWCGRTPHPDANAIRKIIASVGAEEEARELLASHKRQALDALRPLKSLTLKVFLCRVTEKILPA